MLSTCLVDTCTNFWTAWCQCAFALHLYPCALSSSPGDKTRSLVRYIDCVLLEVKMKLGNWNRWLLDFFESLYVSFPVSLFLCYWFFVRLPHIYRKMKNPNERFVRGMKERFPAIRRGKTTWLPCDLNTTNPPYSQSGNTLPLPQIVWLDFSGCVAFVIVFSPCVEMTKKLQELTNIKIEVSMLLAWLTHSTNMKGLLKKGCSIKRRAQEKRTGRRETGWQYVEWYWKW